MKENEFEFKALLKKNLFFCHFPLPPKFVLRSCKCRNMDWTCDTLSLETTFLVRLIEEPKFFHKSISAAKAF